MHQCDLDIVTRLHREEFPSNVVSRFGALVARAYYATFVASPHAVAYVVEVNGRVTGYLVGIVRLGQHRRRMVRQHLLKLGPAAVLGVLSHPVLAAALIRARLARRRKEAQGATRGSTNPTQSTSTPGTSTIATTATTATTATSDATAPAVAVLSHVAVTREGRGRGLGAALVAQFEREAEASGARRLCLATTDDSGAAAFYEHRGWELATRRMTFDHRPISLYELDLSSRRTTTCDDPGA